MLQKTRGIVFHTVNYSETSIVAKIYTESFGLQSYLLKGIKSRKSQLKPVFFQPLNLLELVVYRKEKTTLHTIKEARLAALYQTISGDIRKSSIAIFLNELVYKSIREEESNVPLFEFLWHAFLWLDAMEDHFLSFHLLFALKFCKYLGFQPQSNRDEGNRFFHLREGTFQPVFFSGGDFLDETESAWMDKLNHVPLEQLSQLYIPLPVRNNLLDKVILYYRLHLPGFKGIQSVEVLRTVLS